LPFTHGKRRKKMTFSTRVRAIYAVEHKSTKYTICTDPSGKYWGNSGAGALFYATDTGRYLLAFRSEYVNEPNTWGVWGGKLDKGETPEQAVHREITEETGYHGQYKLKPIFVFQDHDFKYHNFIAEVPEEFKPKLCWETEKFGWFALDDFPQPLHFGVKKLLPTLKTTLEHEVTAKEPDVTGYKTAMTRSGPSAPLKFLLSHNLIPENASVLDYGCGKGADVAHLEKLGYRAVGYDPKWRPDKPSGKYDVVLCTFVLNVIDEKQSAHVIDGIKQHLKTGGHAFISVRRDIPKEGQAGKDCWQRWVECPAGFKTLVENKGFATFQS
jgi:8-oxo-dGTP pyrophosphatase MutT (NUDIX family)